MTRFFASRLALLLCASFAIGQASGQEVLDGIAAVVNDEVITFSQVREVVGAQERAAHEQLKGEELVAKIKELRLKAVNELVERQLILQEFKKNKFNIPDYVLEDRIQTIVREEFGGDRAAFVRTLAAQGFTLDRFKQLEMDKIIVQAMRSQMVKPNLLVPEAEVQAYYRKNSEEFATEEQIKLRMIAIRKSGEGEGRKKMIEEIREKIVGGAEFGDLAKMYSEDSTQEAAGDWGWINRRTLNESLTKIAFTLKVGEVSRVIELGNSYYLLLVEAKKPASVKPLKELREEIEKRLIQAERQRALQQWIDKLRKKAFIKIY